MSTRRQIRELALQAMYQFDARGEDDYEQIAESINAAPHKDATKEEALAMAKGAWADHERADALASELAPSWPTMRQPVVDRNILRLAYYEMAREVAPQPVAINEAIELAKAYGSERSASFVNGVLDKIAKRLRDQAAEDKKAGIETPKGPSTGDAWLDDAVAEPPSPAAPESSESPETPEAQAPPETPETPKSPWPARPSFKPLPEQSEPVTPEPPKPAKQEKPKPAEPVEAAEDEPRPYNPWLDD
jgi:N utilization substance protein B